MREERGEEQRGGTTGGTYCQVGPRGVARVAPLSDGTHKREVGKILATGIQTREKAKTEEGRESDEVQGWQLADILEKKVTVTRCSRWRQFGLVSATEFPIAETQNTCRSTRGQNSDLTCGESCVKWVERERRMLEEDFNVTQSSISNVCLH